MKKKSRFNVTHLSIHIDKEMDDLLERTAVLSHRSKRVEAMLRITDHLKRFPCACINPDIKKKPYKWVSFGLNAVMDDLLFRAKEHSRKFFKTRSKKEEAELRLKDHLQRFSYIETESLTDSFGDNFSRKEQNVY